MAPQSEFASNAYGAEFSSATSSQYNILVILPIIDFCHNYLSAVSTAPWQFLLLEKCKEY